MYTICINCVYIYIYKFILNLESLGVKLKSVLFKTVINQFQYMLSGFTLIMKVFCCQNASKTKICLYL